MRCLSFLGFALAFVCIGTAAHAQDVPTLRRCVEFDDPSVSVNGREMIVASCIQGFVLRGDTRNSGPALLAFAREQDGLVRAAAISALGQIRFTGASEFVGDSLISSDWRVALAASRSIGWLGDVRFNEQLRMLSETHWLVEVREHARRSLDALQSPRRRRRVEDDLNPGYLYVGTVTGSYGISIGNAPECVTQRWMWSGITVHPPDKPRQMLSWGDGELIGSDMGEWGGRLVWRSADGETDEIEGRNVHGIEPLGDVAAAAVGLAHLSMDDGAIVIVHPTSPPSVRQLLVLPGAPNALGVIVPGDTLVVWSHGYAIVFNDEGMLGLAECVP